MARCIARASARHGALAMALALALVVSACSPSLTFASAATTPLVAGDDSSQCETCLVLSHVVYDAVGDPYVEEKMVRWKMVRLCRHQSRHARASSSPNAQPTTHANTNTPQSEYLIATICPNFDDKKSVRTPLSDALARARARMHAPPPLRPAGARTHPPPPQKKNPLKAQTPPPHEQNATHPSARPTS